GDELAGDQAAAFAARDALNSLAINGTVVIGEGPEGLAEELYLGQKLGAGGPDVSIAIDALECDSLAARSGPDAMSVMALAEPGGLAALPIIYMDKIAIGPLIPNDAIDLDAEPGDNIAAVAEALGRPASAITACILDRPRHGDLIGAVRATGARVKLIPEGDIAGVIAVALADSGVDLFLGTGGAAEGVLAAAALRSLGGHIEGRLMVRDDGDRALAAAAGITDTGQKFGTMDLAGGDVIFSATGVTPGPLVEGVRHEGGSVTSHSVVMRSATGTVRWIRANHRPTDASQTS
ncbi:MAG: fructose-bisphosphatase class II, partial [Alphaproteobacteria bacterium]|nr:fructose-bisphosphatase class II [Alphaproteobacteria bacterium]